ncbi:glycoside hydrolase N-terminal domain-containing protein [Georgenia halophila]|uniref:Glycoside hydrolase N-terminal domain-containing protein n=1 Tax=Georgenia halophila TaxID=620889 RepID=A0ABP8L326_9MICO
MNLPSTHGRSRFISRESAPTWEHGVVVGTGRSGALLHGHSGQHHVVLTHEEFFPWLNPAPVAPFLAGILPGVRREVLAGRSARAAELVETQLAADNYPQGVMTNPFLPIASVAIEGDAGHATPGSYRRLVDMAAAAIEISWTDEANGAQRITLRADRIRNTFRIEVHSERPRNVRVTVDRVRESGQQGGGLRATDYTQRLESRVFRPRERTLVLKLSAPNGAGPTGISTVEALSVTGTVGTVGEAGLVVTRTSASDPLVLELATSVADLPTSHGGPDTDAVGISHRELFGRSSLDLAAAAFREVPTEKVHELARSGDEGAQRAAVELAYAAGRYNIVSSTGVIPANLVGVWQGTLAPAWSGDYTLNGNVPVGTAAALVATGTPELALAVPRLLDRILPDFASNAERLFGAAGIHVPARVSTNGHANHFSPAYPHQYWIGGGAWLLRIAYDSFSSTGDTAFLESWLWPFAHGVMAFYETALPVLDGVRHVVPSYSPENSPRGLTTPLAVDATSEVAAVRDAATIAARLATARGEGDLAARWVGLRASLPAYRVADDGTLAEWIDPRAGEQHAHRHVSHLHPFLYEGDEAVGDPRLRAAARALVRTRVAWRAEAPWAPPGHMEMAFGLAQLGIAAATLGESELALQCVHWLAIDHWQPGMVSTHDAGEIFNMDASGALPAVVAAMLLRSSPSELELLPALPTAWRRGSIRGLCGRGGVVVHELVWDGDVASAVVSLRPGSEATRDGAIRVGAGSGFVVQRQDGVADDEAGSLSVTARRILLHR